MLTKVGLKQYRSIIKEQRLYILVHYYCFRPTSRLYPGSQSGLADIGCCPRSEVWNHIQVWNFFYRRLYVDGVHTVKSAGTCITEITPIHYFLLIHRFITTHYQKKNVDYT